MPPLRKRPTMRQCNLVLLGGRVLLGLLFVWWAWAIGALFIPGVNG